MARTIDSNLISDALIESGEALAMKKAVPLTVFCKNFSDEAELYSNGKVKNSKISFMNTKPTVAIDPTVFGNDTSSNISAVDVAMHFYSAPITCAWNDNTSIKDSFNGALESLVEQLVLNATSLFNTSSFGVDKQVSADIAGVQSQSDESAILKNIYKSTDGGLNKYLIGDKDLYACALPNDKNSFKPSEGGFGFDGIYQNNIWAANTTVKGIVTDGRAVAMIARVPQWDSTIQAGMESENIFIPALGITVQFNKWADINGRTVHADICSVFGAALFDVSQTKIILQSA